MLLATLTRVTTEVFIRSKANGDIRLEVRPSERVDLAKTTLDLAKTKCLEEMMQNSPRRSPRLNDG